MVKKIAFLLIMVLTSNIYAGSLDIDDVGKEIYKENNQYIITYYNKTSTIEVDTMPIKGLSKEDKIQVMKKLFDLVDFYYYYYLYKPEIIEAISKGDFVIKGIPIKVNYKNKKYTFKVNFKYDEDFKKIIDACKTNNGYTIKIKKVNGLWNKIKDGIESEAMKNIIANRLAGIALMGEYININKYTSLAQLRDLANLHNQIVNRVKASLSAEEGSTWEYYPVWSCSLINEPEKEKDKNFLDEEAKKVFSVIVKYNTVVADWKEKYAYTVIPLEKRSERGTSYEESGFSKACVEPQKDGLFSLGSNKCEITLRYILHQVSIDGHYHTLNLKRRFYFRDDIGLAGIISSVEEK